MGAVFQAQHVLMHKRLAVKVLHPEMTRMPEVVARFEREAMAAAHIEHPNVAAATDFGKLDDGSFFLVLEYVEGTSLRDLLAEGSVSLARALHITLQIASALARAHALGIVHRDLKPENVMLVERDGDRDFVKVLDFGIAKVPVGELVKSDAGGTKGQVLTQLGMIYGTPEYMAPEQALGQDVDARADLYALGVMLFEMLTGVRPFDAESKVTLLGQKVTRRAPSLSDKTDVGRFAPAVEALVARLLEREADARYPDARSVIDAIDSLALGEAVTLPPMSHLRAGRALLSPTATPGSNAIEGGALVAEDVAAHSADPLQKLGSEPSLPQVLMEAIRERGGPLVEAVVEKVPFRISAVPAQLALVAGAGLLFIVILVVIATSQRGGSAVRVVDGGLVAAAPAIPLAAPKTAPPAELVAAVASGPQALVELSARFPGDPAVFRALAHADGDRKNYPEAIQAVEKLVELDHDAAEDGDIVQLITAAAEGPPDSSDPAFELMEKDLGARGVDLLFDLSQTKGLSPKVLARVKQSLAKADVRSQASPALSILMDMKSASGCEAKRTLLTRARDEGDSRILPVLRTLMANKGCGFLGLGDCWGCMHRDGVLAATVGAIETRTSK
jgi:serine/threonine-protein kinase